MKKKLLALALILTLALTFGLTACGNKEKEAETKTYKAYGPVHNVYVGVAEVTVDKDGKVVDAKLDEYFLPHSYLSADTTATHIRVGGLVFEKIVSPAYDASNPTAFTGFVWNDLAGGTGAARATRNVNTFKQITGNDQEPAGGWTDGNYDKTKVDHTQKIPGLEAPEWTNNLAKLILVNEKVAEWYVNAVKPDGSGFELGTYSASTKTFTPGGKTAADYGSGVKKTDGKYWDYSGHGSPLAWSGNIDAIETAFINYFTAGATLPAAKNQSPAPNALNGSWTLNVFGRSIETGATADDFPGYWTILVKAYAKSAHITPLTIA